MNELQTQQDASVKAGFDTEAGFNLMIRQAKMFSQSTMVPRAYQGQNALSNCMIALNIASQMRMNPLMVMQNLYIVHGTPSWSAKFLIASFNNCGRFTSIKYRPVGKEGADSWGVVAYTTEKSTQDIIEGPPVTIALAKKEGWYGRNGSKWQTMPEVMLRYRAATYLIRITAPELSVGFYTTDEQDDIRANKEMKRAAVEDVPMSADEFGPTIELEPLEVVDPEPVEVVDEVLETDESAVLEEPGF